MEGPSSAPKRYFILALPYPLILSTALVYTGLAQWLGRETGYVLGFLFYWSVWCYTVPLALLGKDNLLGLFREQYPLFRKENWLLIALLVATISGGLFTYFIPNIASVRLGLILIAIPIEIVHGAGEEILWRGVYIKAFPGNPLLALIYPSVAFAIWHLSPQLIFPAESGMLPFLITTFLLGLGYGWIAYRTESVRWVALSHIINGILAFGEPISSSILKIFGL